MAVPSNVVPTPRPHLRLWPGLALSGLILLGRFVIPLFVPGAMPYGVMVGVLGGLLIFLWWLLFSRAPWLERLGVLALMAAALFAASRLVHPSITNGMMGLMLPVFGIQVLSLVLVASAAATQNLGTVPRRAAFASAIVLGCGVFTLIRTGGISGEGQSDIHWRWTQTPEERLLAQAVAIPAPAPRASVVAPESRSTSVEPIPSAAEKPRSSATSSSPIDASVATKPADSVAAWPGFRGANRDGVVHGVSLKADWAATPPIQLWRQPVGPGWSSFAVSGNRAYTQEQRGDDELVSCYDLTTGRLLWAHADRARFWESNGGAGPRATPTLHNGRVYSLGGTGIMNALNAADGSLVWSRNAAADTGATQPGWGFAGSPLVVEDIVVVATSGRLIAYEIETGKPRWSGPTAGGGGYSSPHLARIGGVPQVLLLRGGGVMSVSPDDGHLLWEQAWQPGVSIVQPALTPEGDVLVAAGDSMGGTGLRRLALRQGTSGWSVAELWASRGLKPYFNDFVVHKGHAFGFDGSILSCIDLSDGTRKWKGGRYGSGQLVLFADQDVLLISSEEGGLALVSAKPDGFAEIARFPAIDGKTWNHTALAGDVLLMRNAEEMIAFRLPLQGNPVKAAASR